MPKGPTSQDGTPLIGKQQLELGRESFKRTDNQSEQLNVNGIASGTPVNIWNGTGAGDSGSDWTRSGIGSETTPSAHAGTNGLDTGVTANTDSIVFDSGSMQDIDALVDSVEFWVQLKALVGGGDVRACFVDDTDTLVGVTQKVSDYLSNLDLNVWQKVTIPVSDFALDGDAQKVVLKFVGTSGLHIWIDENLVASLDRYIDKTRPAVTKRAVIEAALADFLRKTGDYEGSL